MSGDLECEIGEKYLGDMDRVGQTFWEDLVLQNPVRIYGPWCDEINDLTRTGSVMTGCG